MKTYIEPQRELKVHDEADVIVVGGGPAGIGASLAAARSGARTILLERFGCLGGLQTQAYQVMFTFCDPKIHGGIFQEILTNLEIGGATEKLADMPGPTEKSLFHQLVASLKGKDAIPGRMYEKAGYWWRWGREFDPEYYKFMLDGMMRKAGVKIYYHAFAAAAIREGDRLQGIILECKEGRKVIRGRVVIDTTGEGDISRKSGAPVIGGDSVQLGKHAGTHGGMINAFYIGGVDLDKFEAFRQAHPEEWMQPVCGKKTIAQGVSEGYDLRADGGVIIFPKQGNRLWVMFPMHVVRGDGRTWHLDEITKSEIEMRRQAWGIQKLFKDRVPGFENSYMEKTAVASLNGEPHRLEGDYILTVADMRQGKIFEDAVGINNMIPDLYSLLNRLSFDILPHDIPYRCLVSKRIDNLMAAGATMSCGSLAMTGLRYCAPSIIQGQAAGTAAAMACENGIVPKQVDINALQENLRAQGAFVSVREIDKEALEPYLIIKEISDLSPKDDIYHEIGKY